MKDQSSLPPDQFEYDAEDKLAFLVIGVDSEGIIDYNAHWQPEENGLLAIASIFYKLIIENLPLQILEEIKEQCVLNDNQGDYLAILELINNFSEQRLNSMKGDDDNIVVPPDQVFNI